MTQDVSTATNYGAEHWACPDWCMTSSEHASAPAGTIHPDDGPYHQHAAWRFKTAEGEGEVKLVQTSKGTPELFIDDLLVSVRQGRALAHLILAATEAAGQDR